MLKPDKELAQDILEELNTGNEDGGFGAATYGVDDMWWQTPWKEMPSQQDALAIAIARWLDRWLRDPQNDALRARGDPLWDAVNTVHAHLKAYVDEWWEREAGDE